MPDERSAYVTLALVPGIGHARMRALLGEFGTANGALAAPFARLCAVRGMSSAAATALMSTPRDSGERAMDAAERLGARVLVPGDDDYPERLTVIPEPPTVLFGAGDLTLLRRPAVAVVGSRDPTMYGVDVCRRLVAKAVSSGLVVVSGMARGLDAAAHEQALALGGGTVGVLGNGLGVVYPAANRRLYERMRECGLLLSEFPPGERPNAGSFPRRNRLISGLAAVTVVVEAGVTSGALITAGTALDQGREVLAVPGPITSPTSAGTNRLIRDGAAPYLEPDDLLRCYEGLEPAKSAAGPAQSSETARVAGLLADDAAGVDTLAARAGLPVAEVLAQLGALEIAGFAEQLPGGRFRRAPGY